MSPKTPYITEDNAEPPTEADEIKPSIAPRFSSGRASISEALKIAFPAALRNPLINAKIQSGINCFAENVSIIKIQEAQKLTDIIQKRDLDLSFNIPKRRTEIRDDKVQAAIR